MAPIDLTGQTGKVRPILRDGSAVAVGQRVWFWWDSGACGVAQCVCEVVRVHRKTIDVRMPSGDVRRAYADMFRPVDWVEW